MATIKSLIQDAINEVLLIPRDEIPNDVRDMCIGLVNRYGRVVFDAWPWDNSKIDEAFLPESDSDGVVEFPATVGEIRAIRTVGTSSESSGPVFAQDEVLAAIGGDSVSSDRFIFLADSATGNRKIRLSGTSDGSSHKYLALKRCPVYSALASTDDGYVASVDYQLVGFVIDRAESALSAFLKDGLRQVNGYPQVGDGPAMLEMALKRETRHQQRETRVNPRYPMFTDIEDWRETT